MRLAIQDSWPNLAENAEREFIQRFLIACRHLDVECHVVVTSDDIEDLRPDVVLVSHEFSRKITSVPTIGLVWSPLRFFQDDPYRVRSLLSYDGYLAGNASIQTYLRDIQSGLGVRKPIAEEIFLPTSYQTEHFALETVAEPSAAYIGVHWDGARHRDLFEQLARRRLVTCYGPEASWKDVPQIYGGYLPFDGHSVMDVLASCGLALCLHKAEHRAENTPSMRLFEALSVGALPICDEIAFARENLADVAEFVDLSAGATQIADQIEDILQRTRAEPEAARARARAGKAWFDANWSLEQKIKKLVLPFVETVLDEGRFRPRRIEAPAAVADPAPPAKAPECEVVIRSGGRDLFFLKRAIASVQQADSPDLRLGVIVVDYKGREDLAAFCELVSATGFPVRYIRSKGTGYRSTALWDGLRAVQAPFVAHLDDDDSVFPNHYRQLAATFDRNPQVDVCYSGVVRIEEEDGFYTSAPNYDGPLGVVIEERRELQFLDAFDLVRLSKFDNFIQSNTWMARTDFVHAVIGDDPELVVVEDVYLYLLMAARGPFAFTGSPTALWHWRSRSSDNSMLAVDRRAWTRCVERAKLRLVHVPFQTTATLSQLADPRTSAAVAEGGGAAPPVAHKLDSLPGLAFNRAVEGGLAFKAQTILKGFHEPEVGGIWSADALATITAPLSRRVRDEGGVLVVECLGSIDSSSAIGRWIEVGLLDGPAKRVDVGEWSLQTVTLPLPPNTSSPVVVQVSSSHVVPPAEGASETRHLGAFVQSLRIVTAGEVADSEHAYVDDVPGGGRIGWVAQIRLDDWRTPVFAGFARGTIPPYRGVNLSFDAQAPGRFFLGHGEGELWTVSAPAGRVSVPAARLHDGAWIGFMPDDKHLSDNAAVFSAPPSSRDAAQWVALASPVPVNFRDYRELNDQSYQHVVANFPHGPPSARDPTPTHLLIKRTDDTWWWLVRPHYGAAWDETAPLASEERDFQGLCRKGRLCDLPDLTELFNGSDAAGAGGATGLFMAVAAHAAAQLGAADLSGEVAAKLQALVRALLPPSGQRPNEAATGAVLKAIAANLPS